MSLQRTNVLQRLASHGLFKSPTQSLALAENLIDARLVKTGFDPNTSRSNFKVMDAVKRGDLHQAHQLFAQMPQRNTITTNLMISSYVKQGNIALARHLFDNMLDRTAVTWTIMIGAYSRSNDFKRAFSVFYDMKSSGEEPDYVTFTTLLSGCVDDKDTSGEVVQLHAHVVKLGCDSNIMVCNSLVDSYCKARRLDMAQRMFGEMPRKDVVTFTSLMTGYSKIGCHVKAVELFFEMRNSGNEPSDFTFAAILCACNGLDDGVVFGEQVHALGVRNGFVCNVFVGNALLDFYSKHDRMVEARRHFDEMPELDVVSYNIVIAGHAWEGRVKEALSLFRELGFTKFNRRHFPYPTVLSLAGICSDPMLGRQIHSQAVVTAADSEILVGNALVDMYAKCGRFEEAKRIFHGLSRRSRVPWTAMISAHVQNELHEEALVMFNEMRRENITADQATFASTLKASASLASLSLGKQLHSCLVRSGFASNVFCGSALVDMYAKCGSMKDALQTFQEMPRRNPVSWNALLLAYAQNGDGEGSFRSFDEMVKSGFEPDSVSFLGVLTACSYSGLVEKALQCFETMKSMYNVTPRIEHYTAIIDVLCRSARFEEAENIMARMPFEADEIIWTSVLNACRIHRNRELAEKASSRLFEMAKLKDGAAYVSMWNIHAAAGEWESVVKVKKAMQDRGMSKVTANSRIEQIKQNMIGF